MIESAIHSLWLTASGENSKTKGAYSRYGAVAPPNAEVTGAARPYLAATDGSAMFDLGCNMNMAFLKVFEVAHKVTRNF